jgi:hypothetical protein
VSTSSATDPIAAIRALPAVRSVTLHDDGSGVPVAVVVVAADARRDRAMLRDEIVRTAAGAGLAVQPAVYDETDWEKVGRLVTLESEHPVAAAVAHHRAVNPTVLRRAMVRIVRELRMGMDAISEPQPVPYHLKLDVCARLVRDGLDLLFAVHDLPITGGVAQIETFDREFVRPGGFAARHATVGLRLSGIARQAELAFWATARDDEHRFSGEAEIDEAADFLRLLERHVERTLTSDAERARAERHKRLVVAGLGPLIAIAFVGYLAAGQPEQPIANNGAITAPGAIAAEYFRGEGFDHKVLERTDSDIAVAANVPPDPRVGADSWSARWSGYMLFDQPGRWHLCGRADEGQRIWLNHRLLVDDWTHDDVRTACATVNVVPGWYPLRVEYHQATGPATLSILRGPPRRSLGAVPPSALCCGTGARPPTT